MTPSKEALLAKLNQQAEAAHAEATENAKRLSKRAPPPPVALVAADVEFPVWLHRGWKKTDKSPGHYEATESRLASNAEEARALLAEGFTESPAKSDAKPSKKE